LIESAIGRPYSGYYRPIRRKAAALVESLCRNHGFVDGNKRTCLILLNLLLDRSGYRLTGRSNVALNNSVTRMLKTVAAGRWPLEKIEGWLAKRIKKKPTK
jgi:death-on-curing protein